MCSIKTSNVYFVDWETTGKDFLKGIKFTSTQKDIKVHVFYNKKTPKCDLPEDYEWVVKHPTLTSSAEASWTALITYVLHFYTHLSCTCTNSRCKLWPRPHMHTKYRAHVVCGDEARYEELAAILKFNKISIKTINAEEKTLLDIFQFSCGQCKTIFKTKEEATRHDLESHNFLCGNSRCEKSKRQNGFFTKKELEEHKAGQQSCEFCPEKIYCTRKKLEEHLKKFHKKCDCSCEEFFETSDDYLEHYYSNLPLPCLEEPSCNERFPNIEHQAFHHKQVHGSTYPYFCMACYKHNYLVCLKTAEELLNHVEEEKHQDEEFSFAQIPVGIALGNQ
ncbi:predicted protein [Nematostella vectensis]|uniref:C2H2-type domain-containing protein n=1 Tax=Nematostella vectensis TaxID=45351 RepID=A7SSU9_NEMVE|nr:uncharacterized protein LOC5504396 [Nematostella vectensis]EDO33203.1 predicted protein [Nematostella vectensis]|eukprot:XP_001625303.1 predicted protein [Nematostella vectensis]